jgi:hypothetical protein
MKLIINALLLAISIIVIFGCGRGVVPVVAVPPASLPPSQSCTIKGVTNGAVINCPDGTTQTISDGVNGINGASATSISMVEFCPTYVPQYPTVFPEYGICIQGSLYAVYSSQQMGTFLAYVPPGIYSSTSNSAACNFTVSSNCVVTQL